MPSIPAFRPAWWTLALCGGALGLAGAAAPAKAAAAAGEPAAAASAAEPAPAASAAGATAPVPANGTTVSEDDHVRIVQTRVHGQVQRVVVQSKLRGVKPYEILLDPGRDPALGRGVDGQRAWSVLDF